MKQIVTSVLLISLLYIATPSYTQTVKGHWFGIGMVQGTNEYDSYLSELILRQKGKLVWGEFDYYFKDSLIKVPINGSFDELTRSRFTGVDFLLVRDRHIHECQRPRGAGASAVLQDRRGGHAGRAR